MNWFRQLHYKNRLGLVLVALISVILLNNIYSRQSVTDLDHAISSIYKDRLMPATYIFQLTDHLYQKRLLHDQHPGNERLLQQHNDAINTLIHDYETTHLTKEEHHHWHHFKRELDHYNAAVGINASGGSQAGEQRFSQTLQHLNSLSQIQAGEGNHLHKDTIDILNNTTMRSYLEVVLIIALGLLAVVMLGLTQKGMYQMPQQASLN